MAQQQGLESPSATADYHLCSQRSSEQSLSSDAVLRLNAISQSGDAGINLAAESLQGSVSSPGTWCHIIDIW